MNIKTGIFAGMAALGSIAILAFWSITAAAPSVRSSTLSGRSPAPLRRIPSHPANGADEKSEAVAVVQSNSVVVEAENRFGENPDEALDWLSHLPDEQYRLVVTDSGLCTSIQNRADYLANRSGTEGSAALENYAVLWARYDFNSALEWARQQSPGEVRNALIGRISSIYAETNPKAAADLVAREVSPGLVQEEIALSIVHYWGMQDMVQASAWVQQFPSGPMRLRAMRELEGIAAYQKIYR